MTTGFVPPPYPYDRLNTLKAEILERHDSIVDLSIGTPFDPPPESVVKALSSSGAERAYPPSVGTPEYHAAIQRWFARRCGVELDPSQIGATVGSKEFVALLPQFMGLRNPDRDTVLYPSIAYPSYEMGATLAGLRAVPVAADPAGGIDLTSVDSDDVERALLLWVNSPANPTGGLDDLGAVAEWGRTHGVPVFSDECYIEFTWSDRGRTILEHGHDGVVAVHSLSKRSNFAGARAGFYAGDREIVHYLREVRKHAGLMVPGPVQAAAAVALDDDQHVTLQRDRYRQRLERLADVLSSWSGREVPMPDGAFYLWMATDDGWELTRRLAHDGGALVSPGEFYGPDGAGYVRVAVVQPDEQIDVVVDRLKYCADG
ncbi:aminotransferase class I/II-fold pyridoxal phosphate-dependent enzyme [Ilumatobacter nonamiensis]|uniref:aminotransferase class I/II-fold pyridoxal phosphate-dependent enzyme n=1 Tax=Ilumatobacter nonamiensis TaxID=467093 RepID=UPI0003457856|nr:aminotransferase class I/II-fold pyridoxal phosphate-dependent enzyme [Ilumatobacter nonamiensis]